VTEMTPDFRRLLRHTIATLAYRGGKVLRDAPEGFEAFCAGETTRSAVAILAHINDVLDWALRIAKCERSGKNAVPGTWESEVRRFFGTLSALDDYLASEHPLHCTAEALFQGPIADAFTHVGQIALLRRLAGSPVRGENYFKADIAAGRVGPEQSPPVREFDLGQGNVPAQIFGAGLWHRNHPAEMIYSFVLARPSFLPAASASSFKPTES
jgi:hypothetical protein